MNILTLNKALAQDIRVRVIEDGVSVFLNNGIWFCKESNHHQEFFKSHPRFIEDPRTSMVRLARDKARLLAILSPKCVNPYGKEVSVQAALEKLELHIERFNRTISALIS